ncbi:MAG TPA: hypothetical protein VE710_00300 [Candidatus Bathyarchaeia archaeon]|uniref:hypothetical protein n=1 Tax=Brevibacillus migulae TaxID=1644114 RepID=UPI00106E9227|nr:hypothetical protein [Brevibacillus migulae]HZG13439.1 hypothetical protein [Candidatus Bathyarchaeia archaeon]
MDLSLSSEQVRQRIRDLRVQGGNLSKKSVKSTDPELMRHALFYFPSWDSALKAADDVDIT